MKKYVFTALAAGSALALGACQSERADEVEDAAEAEAEALDEMADEATSEAAEESLEREADMVEEMGEERANAMDDDGEIAPSETGIGDTQNHDGQ
ncbi:MAG: hypothetical protein HKN78_11405 [Sphingomonadaceae bacterium]|nr:hypothetical protein [Sphingomonadaceae bacterium]